MSLLRLLVGPPGSGKSTYAKNAIENDGDLGATTVYINQDTQGKEQHKIEFDIALSSGQDVIVDRMNFNKFQREYYLDRAKQCDYKTKIVVFHESYGECLKRCVERKDHLTIKDEETAKRALHHFFTRYERVEDSEADEVVRLWPEGIKPLTVMCDLDGTLCNIDHRLEFVKNKPKNWKLFFEGISGDKINKWCLDLIEHMSNSVQVVFCSGRGFEYQGETLEWLTKHGLNFPLYMRHAGDHRQDYIVKEIILDFEVLTRYTPYFAIDDRQQVVDMWRKRGITCLQCAKGDF